MKHETLTFRFLDMSRGGFARLFLLLLLPCLSVIGVKAAVSNGGVKFNSGVRYSQWAINSRLYDFRGNQNAYGFAKWNSNTESLGEYANKANMKLDYVAGLVGKATTFRHAKELILHALSSLDVDLSRQVALGVHLIVHIQRGIL